MMSSVDLQTHAVLKREVNNEKLPKEVKEWLEKRIEELESKKET